MSIALPNALYPGHPSMELLERFLLHHVAEDELDRVETHILACEDCVLRLEDLEVQMAATKLALQQLAQTGLRAQSSNRFSFGNHSQVGLLSWAGAAAAAVLAVALTFIPRPVVQPRLAVEVTLSAYRGSEMSVVPQGKDLDLQLNAPEVQNAPVVVAVVDGFGNPVYQQTANVQSEHVRVSFPKIEKSGPYFLRLYAPKSGNAEDDLLREFSFQVGP